MPEEIFDESHFFMCEGGLKPARLNTNQKIVQREDGKYYLTEFSLKCKGIDFACAWVALLYAIVAAAMALLLSCPVGWVLLAAIVGGAVGAGIGAAMCGDMAAIMRVWIVIKTDAQFDEFNAVANRQPPHLMCNAFGKQIVFKPNVTSEFQALVIFAGNTLMKGLEGFMYVYAFRGGVTLFTKPLQFFANFGVNYLKTLSVSGIAGRGLFGVWGGFNAYSMSNKEMTVSEGLQSKEVWSEAGKGFGFAEVAMYNAATERDPQSIALLMSMGGIPSAKGDYSTTKELLENSKDNFNTDKTLLDLELKNELNNVKNGWENPGEILKNDVKNTLNEVKRMANEFREKLKGQKKGVGAKEEGFADPRNPEVIKLLEEAQRQIQNAKSFEEAAGIGSKLAEDIANLDIGQKQKPGNVTIYEGKDGKFYIDTSLKPGGKPKIVREDATSNIKNDYDNIPNGKQGKGHGNCGEPGVYSQASREGNFGGGKKQSWGIDGKRVYNQPSCSSCGVIDTKYGIRDMSPVSKPSLPIILPNNNDKK